MQSESKHIEYMRIAIQLASSQLDRIEGRPFGAVIVRDDVVIGKGYNRAVMDHDPTSHAEVVAIRDACKNIQSYRAEGAIMYSSCEPCPMCLSAIYWAGIQTLYFGCSSQDAEKFGFGDTMLQQQLCIHRNERTLKSFQLLEQEALLSFEEWSNKGGVTTSLTYWK